MARRCNWRPDFHSAGSPLGHEMEINLEKTGSRRSWRPPSVVDGIQRSCLRRMAGDLSQKLSHRFYLRSYVIWTAFRFTQRETATGIFILSVIAVWGTLRGFGPFVDQSENQSLLTVQSWTAVLAITMMALSAGMAERRRIEEELHQQKAVVETANRTK